MTEMPNSWWEEGFCKDCPACVPCHDYGQHCRLNPRSITFEDEDRDFFPTIWHPESDWCIAGRRLMAEIRGDRTVVSAQWNTVVYEVVAETSEDPKHDEG